MEETKHTPGHWVVAPPFEEDGLIEIPIGVMTPMGLFTVAVVMGGMSPEMQVANAGLIVAAPKTAIERDQLKGINSELLEALHRMVCNPDSKNLDFARAAIAKSTGQSK